MNVKGKQAGTRCAILPSSPYYYYWMGSFGFGITYPDPLMRNPNGALTLDFCLLVSATPLPLSYIQHFIKNGGPKLENKKITYSIKSEGI